MKKEKYIPQEIGWSTFFLIDYSQDIGILHGTEFHLNLLERPCKKRREEYTTRFESFFVLKLNVKNLTPSSPF